MATLPGAKPALRLTIQAPLGAARRPAAGPLCRPVGVGSSRVVEICDGLFQLDDLAVEELRQSSGLVVQGRARRRRARRCWRGGGAGGRWVATVGAALGCGRLSPWCGGWRRSGGPARIGLVARWPLAWP